MQAPHSPRSSATGQPGQSQPKRTAAKVLTTAVAPQRNKAQKSTDRSSPSAQLHAEPASGTAAVALPSQAAQQGHSTEAECQRPREQRSAVTTWDELAAKFEGRYGQPARGAAHQSGGPAPVDNAQQSQPATDAVSQADAEQAGEAMDKAAQSGGETQQEAPVEAGAQEVEGDAVPLEQAAQQPSAPNEAAGTCPAAAARSGADSIDDGSDISDGSAAAGTPEHVDQTAACESPGSSSTSSDSSHEVHSDKIPSSASVAKTARPGGILTDLPAMGCWSLPHQLHAPRARGKTHARPGQQGWKHTHTHTLSLQAEEQPRMLTNPLAESPRPFAAASSVSPAASGLSEGLLAGDTVTSPTLLLHPQQPGEDSLLPFR